MLFAIAAILAVIGAIVFAELFDGRETKRQQQIMHEGLKVLGTVQSVEHKGYLVKGVYRWSISVEFEYDGHTYFLEQGSINKPMLYEGNHITVYVYEKDPWKSRFIVDTRIPSQKNR